MEDSASHLQNLDISLLRREAHSSHAPHEHDWEYAMYTVSAKMDATRPNCSYYNTFYVYNPSDRRIGQFYMLRAMVHR